MGWEELIYQSSDLFEEICSAGAPEGPALDALGSGDSVDFGVRRTLAARPVSRTQYLSTPLFDAFLFDSATDATASNRYSCKLKFPST